MRYTTANILFISGVLVLLFASFYFVPFLSKGNKAKPVDTAPLEDTPNISDDIIAVLRQELSQEKENVENLRAKLNSCNSKHDLRDMWRVEDNDWFSDKDIRRSVLVNDFKMLLECPFMDCHAIVDVDSKERCGGNSSTPLYIRRFQGVSWMPNVPHDKVGSSQLIVFEPEGLTNPSCTWRVRPDLCLHSQVQVGTVSVFYFDHPWIANIQHYFIEMFPRIELYFQLKEFLPDVKLAISDGIMARYSYIPESLAAVGIDLNADIVSVKPGTPFSQIYIGSSPGCNFGPMCPIVQVSWKRLRVALFSDVNMAPKEENRYFFSRRDAMSKGTSGAGRYAENLEELAVSFKKKFNITERTLIDLSLQERVTLLSQAQVVVMEVGATLANMLWIPSTCKIVVIDHPNPVFSPEDEWWKNFATMAGVTYRVLHASVNQHPGEDISLYKPYHVDIPKAMEEMAVYFDEMGL